MSGFWHVALPAPFRTPLDYAVPPSIIHPEKYIGCRVQVPLGRGIRIGIITEYATTSILPSDKIKAALTLLDEVPLWNPSAFALMRWASHYYHHPLGDVLLTGLPKALREGKPLSLPAAPIKTAPTDLPLALTPSQQQCVTAITEASSHYKAFLLFLNYFGPR